MCEQCVLHTIIVPLNLETRLTSAHDLSNGWLQEGVEQSQVGTPLFAAPEVLAGEYYDQSCDIYSFGVLLLTMSVDVKILNYFGDEYERNINGKKKSWLDVIAAIIKGFRPRTMNHTPKTIQHLTKVNAR